MSGRRRSSRPQRPSLRAREVESARQRRALEQQQQENKTQDIRLGHQLQQAEFNSQYNTAREMLKKMTAPGVDQRTIPDAPTMETAREYAQRLGMPIVRALPPNPHQPFFFDPVTNAATYIDPRDVQAHEVHQELGPARPVPPGPSVVHAFDSDGDAEMETAKEGVGESDDDDVGDSDAQQLFSGSRPASPGLLGALALGDEGGGDFSFEDLEHDPVIGAGRGGRRKRRKKKTRRKRGRKRRKRQTRGRRR